MTLVNDVNESLNEVALTDVNFASATGYYRDAKRAVNSSLRQINQHGVEWPFNHVKYELTTVVNQVRYAYPVDAKNVLFNTFRVRGDEDLNLLTGALFPLDYEDYIQRYSDMEYAPDKYAGTPTTVFRTPSLEYGLLPPPDRVYSVDFEYMSIPLDLVNATDVPTVPEIFRHVIHDGAMYYAYMFRGDVDSAQLQEMKFKEGINKMVSIYINRYEYLRSTQR